MGTHRSKSGKVAGFAGAVSYLASGDTSGRRLAGEPSPSYAA